MLLRRYHNQSKAVQKTALTAPSEPTPEKMEYTAEDIEKMPYFKVKSLAKSLGIDITEKGTKEMKEAVREYYGL